MNKKEQTLLPRITRDVELGGKVVTQYGITCNYEWHGNKKFSLQIGNMQEDYMKNIEADYFWGFADMFNVRTGTGVLYAVFSKGDDLLVHEAVNNQNGYSNYRTLVLNATTLTQKTYIGSKKGMWFRFHKPFKDSFEGAYVALKETDHGNGEDRSWKALMFPEYAYSGMFKRLPFNQGETTGVLDFVSDKTGVLSVTNDGKEILRLLEVGEGIVFEGIYFDTFGSLSCVAVFTYGEGKKLHVRPNLYIGDSTINEAGVAVRQSEVFIYTSDKVASMYSHRQLRTSKLWLDEDGVLCAPMSLPKPSEGSYWRFEEDGYTGVGWNIYDPEEEETFNMEQTFKDHGLHVDCGFPTELIITGVDEKGYTHSCTLQKQWDNKWTANPRGLSTASQKNVFENSTLGSIRTRKVNVLANGVLDVWNIYQQANKGE